jgi:hypothetical protein
VRYQDAAFEHWLAVTTTASADPKAPLAMARWIGGPDGGPTTVRGHDGWFAPVENGITPSQFLLAWEEAPGIVVTVTAGGLDEATVRRAAEGLRPATDAEWHRLVASGDPPDEGADLPTLARGDGWRYSQDTDRGVCFEAKTEGGVGGSCSDPGALDDPQLYEGADDAEGGGWWLHGRVPDDVTRVRVEPDGGDAQVVDTVGASRGPGRAWAAQVPKDERSVTITALTADGTEVDTAIVTPQSGWAGGAPGATSTTTS